MSRYIDAEALEKRRIDYLIDGYADSVDDMVEWGMAIIEAPSIDIVRCKECRYCKMKRGTFKGEPITFYRCEENNRDVESDDFCSWGERKSDE